MKIILQVNRNIDTPEQFIDYYKDMTKALIVQGQKLHIPNSILGKLTISASIAFLKAFLKDPSKKNMMNKFSQAYDLMKMLDDNFGQEEDNGNFK
uniref:Uncharacterized protein n=1 Tax=viral metagenome TaxID=1070528 RepID=A0A6M3L986_9ZZZZ